MNEETKDCARLPVVAWRCTADGEHYALFEKKTCRFCNPLCDHADAQTRLAEKDARIAELERLRGDGTTSDKYRAELYDEVWQRAAGMGYGNVTMALEDLDAFRSHIHTDNAETLANALKDIERLKRTIEAGVENELALVGERTELRAQLQAAPAEREAKPTAWQLKGWNYCLETAAEAIHYLLKNGKPAAYGNSRYNEEHCLDIINSLGVEVRERKKFFDSLNPAPATADSDAREVK